MDGRQHTEASQTVFTRRIIHIDMDAFFAAIEQRDNAKLRGKPIIVGGAPNKRGVVATCSYEARYFGIHSAMPSSRAARLCPQAIFIKPRFEVYRQVSHQIHSIFLRFSDLVEMLSLDEAYLDVSAYSKDISEACEIAKAIKKEIRAATRLTASAGVAGNKFLAKIASDMNKPDGLYVISPERASAFVADLAVSRFYGIGKVTASRMEKMGIKTGADLRRYSMDEMVAQFGKVGIYYYHAARARDDRLVVVDRQRKSIGSEKTYPNDLIDVAAVHDEIKLRSLDVAHLLVKHGCSARTVTLKVKYADFHQITRSHTFDRPMTGLRELRASVIQLAHKTDIGKRAVRLLGVSVSNLCDNKTKHQQAFEFSGND